MGSDDSSAAPSLFTDAALFAAEFAAISSEWFAASGWPGDSALIATFAPASVSSPPETASVASLSADTDAVSVAGESLFSPSFKFVSSAFSSTLLPAAFARPEVPVDVYFNLANR